MKMHELVATFQRTCPELVLSMKNADHHYSTDKLNPYHLESDVWTHTMQVCLMAERFQVNDIVKLAALFHDLGKPMARELNEEKQRVHFFGHEGASVFLTLGVLDKMEIELSKEDKAHLLNLISHHTNLYKVFEGKNKDFTKEVVETYVGNRRLLQDLIWLSKCDSLGRFTGHDVSYAENLEVLLEPALSQIKDKPVNNSSLTCTILVGPPCSGKSTWIRENQTSNSIVISRDDLVMEYGQELDYAACWAKVDQKFIDQELLRRKMDAIAEGKSLIVDMTNCSPKSRRQSFGQVPNLYKKQAVVFYTTIDTLLTRNRIRAEKDNKFLKDSIILQFVKGFTAPLLDEVDEIVYYINNK